MTRDNTVRSMPRPGPGLASKSRELAHREPILSQPNWFQVNRRLKEIEAQQLKTEEMLSTIFLTLEDIRVAVGATGEEPVSGLGFRLPNKAAQAAELELPWWKKLWYSFVAPWKLRRPAADRWSQAEELGEVAQAAAAVEAIDTMEIAEAIEALGVSEDAEAPEPDEDSPKVEIPESS